MLRRRRRRTGTWLPTIGSTVTGDTILPGRQFGLTGGVAATQPILIFPVVYDVPQWNDATATAGKGMGEIIGNEYLIQRIVGKVHIQYTPNINGSNENVNFPVIVGAGFFVARAQPDVTGNRDQPIGSASTTAQLNEYSPLDGDTIREPWMWRRTWVLGNPPTLAATAAATDAGAFNWPPSTAYGGSVHEGPHIDVKSKRRVRQDERLWFAVAFSSFIPGFSVEAEEITGYLDVRVFGNLRRARNQGTF